MKKITFLLLLLVSSLILSQTTDTPQLTKAQLEEVYKGLKQNDYLKIRVKQAEKTLDDAQALIQNQNEGIAKRDEIITLKTEQMENLKFIHVQELESKQIEIGRLNSVMVEMEKQYKKQGRKKLWNGILIGGTTVVVLGGVAAGLILLN